MTYLERMNQAPAVSQFPSYAAISGVSNTGLDAIRNAQKEHPEYYPKSFLDAFNTFQEKVETGINPDAPVNPAPAPYKPSAKGLTPAKVEEIDYINADLAKYYGMSKSTAYQEALSNTSYQRAVKDMKGAGLNPAVLFGSGHGQSANSSIYASEAAAGGGGGSRRRRYGSGSAGKDGNLFSPGAYYGISTAVGLATAVLTKNPANYWIGSAGAQGILGAINAAWKK